MNSAQEKGGRERAGKRNQQFIIWYDKNKLTIFSHCFVLVEKLGQWAVTIGKDSSSSKMEKFIRNTFFSTLPLHFFNSDYECAFQKTLSPVCLFSEKISFQFQLVRILWIILVSNWIDIFPTLLGHFSTLVPIDNLLHYSAYTPKKSAFYANWFGNAKQLYKKWKI